MLHRGWIALDIDGTVTDQPHHIPPQVISYLEGCQKLGWQIIFITGRTFSFGFSSLQEISFPYFFAVQNGADILEMPSRKAVSRSYLPAEMVSQLEKVYEGQEEDFILYTGFEKGDFCYYRPQRFSPRLLAHLEKLKKLSPEPWKAVDTFEFAAHESFPLIKCLGSVQVMCTVSGLVQPIKTVSSAMIRDPMAEGIYLNLITDVHATKGNALQRMVEITGLKGPLIAAGDDLNDVTMLKVADVSIVMETAPQEMHQEGDIIAKSASDCGIIAALEQAIAQVDARREEWV